MTPRRSNGPGPQRTCVQCGTGSEKGRMLRIAGKAGSEWTPDPDGKLPGRGIYLCRGGDCIERFSARIRTRKGGARWKMGDGGGQLADRLTALRAGEAKS
jgi:predicted RNA-binding protein YlxR (DUF448 family)